MSDVDMIVQRIISALKTLRVGVITEEFDLQSTIASVLDDYEIHYSREYKLGPRNRADFFIDGVVIEVKKGKPYTRQVTEQLERYAAFPEVYAIILVVEKNLDIPKYLNKKPCISFGLNKQWGIALR